MFSRVLKMHLLSVQLIYYGISLTFSNFQKSIIHGAKTALKIIPDQGILREKLGRGLLQK